MGRILALDYGRVRIGVALSDETKNLSFPQPYLTAKDKGKLPALVAQRGVELVILGLPKSLRGGEGRMAEEVRQFGDWLEGAGRVPVRYVDERFTTHQAKQKLAEAAVGRSTRREQVDSIAAHILLEQYLHDLKKT